MSIILYWTHFDFSMLSWNLEPQHLLHTLTFLFIILVVCSGFLYSFILCEIYCIGYQDIPTSCISAFIFSAGWILIVDFLYLLWVRSVSGNSHIVGYYFLNQSVVYTFKRLIWGHLHQSYYWECIIKDKNRKKYQRNKKGVIWKIYKKKLQHKLNAKKGSH